MESIVGLEIITGIMGVGVLLSFLVVLSLAKKLSEAHENIKEMLKQFSYMSSQTDDNNQSIERLSRRTDDLRTAISDVHDKIEKTSVKVEGAVLGLNSYSSELMRSFLQAVDSQDAVKLSQVVRSVRSMLDRDYEVSREIENYKYNSAPWNM